jgi:F-box-like
MAQLPQELACHILMLLDDVRSLVSASLVSKRWHHLCRDNLVWKRKYTLQKSWKKIPQSASWVDYRDLYIRQMRIADRWRKGSVTTSYLTGWWDYFPMIMPQRAKYC